MAKVRESSVAPYSPMWGVVGQGEIDERNSVRRDD